MSPKYKLKFFALLTTIAACTIFTSNLAAIKVWDFFGIPVDAGILVFPFSYIINDLVIEFFGKKLARNVVLTSVAMNVFMALILYIAVLLPPSPAYSDTQNNQAFSLVFSFAPRILFASLTAYTISQLVNNYIFEFIRQKTANLKSKSFTNGFIFRAITSSFVARFFDIAVFEIIAFLGLISFDDFLKQAIFAYFAGTILELIITPISYFIVQKVKKHPSLSL